MKGYMCGTDWTAEAGEIAVKVYSSEEELMECEGCWEECGIVEVEMVEVRWLRPGKGYPR